jgi:trypsin
MLKLVSSLVLIIGFSINTFSFNFENPSDINSIIKQTEIKLNNIVPSRIPNYQIIEDYNKIIGGIPANEGEFPFIVSLQAKRWGNPQSYSHFCGGSLIKEDWVLTAAHCVDGGYLNGGRIVAGLYKLKEDGNAEKFTPVKIIKHPNWNSKTMDYDFALVKLDRKSSYSPIKLNNISYITEKDGVVYTVAGWGTTSEGGSISNTLLKVDVPFVSKDACQKAYSENKIAITDSMLCAGYPEGGKDSCQGDSGGPLIYKTKSSGNYYLVGVVSWGIGCARPYKYGVYSKVSYVLKWIEETIKENQ